MGIGKLHLATLDRASIDITTLDGFWPIAYFGKGEAMDFNLIRAGRPASKHSQYPQRKASSNR